MLMKVRIPLMVRPFGCAQGRRAHHERNLETAHPEPVEGHPEHGEGRAAAFPVSC